MNSPGTSASQGAVASAAWAWSEHVAPARVRRLDADAEETQRRLQENPAGKGKRQRDSDGLSRIRQEVSGDQSCVAGPRRARALDEVARTERASDRRMRETYDWRDVFGLAFMAFWIGFGLAVTLIALGVLPHPSL